MPGPGRQTAVTGLGGPLVYRPPRHLDGDHMLREGRTEAEHQRAQAVSAGKLASHRSDARPTRRLAMRLQHLPQSVAVPVLLVAPAGQEGGDLRVSMGAGHEYVAQVAHGVVL